MFSILTILKYMLTRIAPQSNWLGRLDDLLQEYPDIPLLPMGVPDNWKECPVWLETGPAT